MSSFRDLHQPGKPFILANAWDAGSAKLFAALGASAIASTSAGHAFTIGRPDMGTVTREEALTHAKDLIAATPLPVSGDFENGFGHDGDTVAETIRLSAQAGLAGISIEDTALPDVKPYEFNHAVERIEAAAAAARALSEDFVLLARADGYMNRQYDFEEAMRRAKAFEAAGADAIYIPLLKDLEMVRHVCSEINVPVNVLCAGNLVQHSIDEFASAGVARISLGSMAARVVHQATIDIAKRMFDDGKFDLLEKAASGAEVDKLLVAGSR